ncbi:MAG: sigma-70 family RNA polymerase sigma factor [Saprospiraceae bacterium]
MPNSQIPYQSLIFSLAYNMLGSYASAQDILQDMQLKFLENQFPIDAPKSYYLKATVNHCLNIAKKQNRTTYPGPWLPEPFINGPASIETVDLLHYELASLIESLPPIERAIFVLKEAMGFSHKEIAEALELSEKNTRQLFSRSKKKIQSDTNSASPSKQAKQLAEQLIRYILEGNVDALVQLFSEDIKVISDGGGKVHTAKLPVVGREKVAKFLVKISRLSPFVPEVKFTKVLSQTALAFFQGEKCLLVWVLSTREDTAQISRIFAIVNPDKLTFM